MSSLFTKRRRHCRVSSTGQRIHEKSRHAAPRRGYRGEVPGRRQCTCLRLYLIFYATKGDAGCFAGEIIARINENWRNFTCALQWPFWAIQWASGESIMTTRCGECPSGALNSIGFGKSVYHQCFTTMKHYNECLCKASIYKYRF